MRALVGHRLLRGEPVVVVATPAALTAPLLKPADYRARLLRLELGEHRGPREPGGRARGGGLRARGSRRGGRAVEPARRHHRHLLAVARAAGARGALRRRDRVAAPVRPDHPALGRGPPGAGRPAAGRARRGRRPRSRTTAAPSPPTCRAIRLAVLLDPAVLDAPPDDAPVRGAAGRPARRVPAPGPRPPRAGRPREGQLRHGHALGRELPRPVQAARGRDREVARRGLRDPPGRQRREPGGRASSKILAEHGPRGLAGRDALELRRPGRAGGRRRHGLPAPRAGAGRSHRGGDLRRAPPAPPAPALPAGRRHRLVLRPGGERPRGARVARGGPLSRDPDAQDRRPGRGLPAPGVRRRRPALPARRAARSHLEVPGGARRRGQARPAGRRRLEQGQGIGARRPARDGGGAAEALRRARRWPRARPSARTRRGSASSRRPSASRRRRTSRRPSTR